MLHCLILVAFGYGPALANVFIRWQFLYVLFDSLSCAFYVTRSCISFVFFSHVFYAEARPVNVNLYSFVYVVPTVFVYEKHNCDGESNACSIHTGDALLFSLFCY